MQDFCGALDVVVLPVVFVDVSMHSCLSFAGSYLFLMFCLHDRRCWFKLLFNRKVLSQCRQISSPFSLIRMDAMNSGVSFDIFTFKQPLSIVLELIATLCTPKIYFENSKIYESHCRQKFVSVLFNAMASSQGKVSCCLRNDLQPNEPNITSYLHYLTSNTCSVTL